jgi:hypothetical protein
MAIPKHFRIAIECNDFAENLSTTEENMKLVWSYLETFGRAASFLYAAGAHRRTLRRQLSRSQQEQCRR